MAVKIGSLTELNADAVEVSDLNAEEHGSVKSVLTRTGLTIDGVQVIGDGTPPLAAYDGNIDHLDDKLNEVIAILIRSKLAVGVTEV